MRLVADPATPPPATPLLSRRAALAAVATAFAARAAPLSATTSQDNLRFGVFPYLPPLALDRLFAPVLTSLARAVHRPVLMRTKATFAEFQAAVGRHDYHLAFVHPFAAARAIDEHGYRPLVRLDAPFRLVFLTRTGSDVAAIEDLRGQWLATPPALSAAAVMAEMTLARHGLRLGVDVLADPTPSKMSCVHKVLRGSAAGCSIPRFAIRQLALDEDPRLVTFHREQLPVSLSMITAPHLAPATADRLGREICAWSDTTDGRALLRHAGWPGFVAARPSDYEPARAALRLRAELRRP